MIFLFNRPFTKNNKILKLYLFLKLMKKTIFIFLLVFLCSFWLYTYWKALFSLDIMLFSVFSTSYDDIIKDKNYLIPNKKFFVKEDVVNKAKDIDKNLWNIIEKFTTYDIIWLSVLLDWYTESCYWGLIMKTTSSVLYNKEDIIKKRFLEWKDYDYLLNIFSISTKILEKEKDCKKLYVYMFVTDTISKYINDKIIEEYSTKLIQIEEFNNIQKIITKN